MGPLPDKKPSVLRNIDWWTIAIYLLLLVFGWASVCGASYTYGDELDIFNFATRSGMQIVWIGTSLVLGLLILLLDDRFYDTFAYAIYALLLLLLFATIFNPHSIKGSHSWLVLGPLRLQPAEFAKFATALCAAKLMSSYGYNIHRMKDFGMAIAVVVTPMLFIVLQHETGSALVYLSFFLMFYREGMPGSILFTGVAAVFYFVVGIKYSEIMLWDTPTSVGKFAVLFSILIFSASMVWVYCKESSKALSLMLYGTSVTLIGILVSHFVVPFDVSWLQLGTAAALIGYLVYQGLSTRLRNYFYIGIFAVGSLAFYYSADHLLNHTLEHYQRKRINVLLGLIEDPSGVGYNVRQSQIAIGSGGVWGKGFLNGTQTKLKYVPEQDTDFIFCTVGEEQGFVGSCAVLVLFLLLIWRLIYLSERQSLHFGRIYGYCVLSIFLFHVFINVGMVLGLTPVIGIPLPFFSYGGSSLWGFTILLFIFLRIDASRKIAQH